MIYRLLDLMYHARLHDVGQVVACLQMVDEALASLRHDATARFCGFVNEGHCFVIAQTTIASRQQNSQVLGDKALSPAA
jgi:hypothetical protein